MWNCYKTLLPKVTCECSPSCLSRSTHKEFLNLKFFYWLDPRHEDKKLATEQYWSYCRTTSTQEDSVPPLIQNLVPQASTLMWPQRRRNMATTGEHNTQHEVGHRRKEETQTSLADWLHSVPRHNSWSPNSSCRLFPHTRRGLLIKIEHVSYLQRPILGADYQDTGWSYET